MIYQYVQVYKFVSALDIFTGLRFAKISP